MLKAVMDDSINDALRKAVAPLHEQIGALKERVDIAEAIADSRSGSGGEGDDADVDDDDDDSTSELSVLDDEGMYVPIDVKRNKHFGAAELASNDEHKPHRHSLYGQRAWMVLTKGGNDTGGTLGFALGYAEPLSLYGKVAADKADDLAERFAEGDFDPREFLDDLVAMRNTLREQYRLANVFRSIVVQKARALRPNATEYDKAEVKYLERALDEQDFASPDTAAEIDRLRGRFAKKAQRSSLDSLARKASGGGGGGGAAADTDSDDSGGGGSNSKSKKRREKAKAKKRADRAEREAAAERERKRADKKPRRPEGGGGGDKSSAPPKRSDSGKGGRPDAPKSGKGKSSQGSARSTGGGAGGRTDRREGRSSRDDGGSKRRDKRAASSDDSDTDGFE